MARTKNHPHRIKPSSTSMSFIIKAMKSGRRCEPEKGVNHSRLQNSQPLSQLPRISPISSSGNSRSSFVPKLPSAPAQFTEGVTLPVAPGSPVSTQDSSQDDLSELLNSMNFPRNMNTMVKASKNELVESLEQILSIEAIEEIKIKEEMSARLSTKSLEAKRDFCIPVRVFQRICQEISFNIGNNKLRFKGEALTILQQFVEELLVERFQAAALIMANAGRKTLMVKDVRLVDQIRKMNWEPL